MILHFMLAASDVVEAGVRSVVQVRFRILERADLVHNPEENAKEEFNG